MISLIMGLLALACNIVAFIPITNYGSYLSIIAFVLAIIAVATGRNILRADKQDKNARAGKAIGTVCIVIAILYVVIRLILISLGIVASFWLLS